MTTCRSERTIAKGGRRRTMVTNRPCAPERAKRVPESPAVMQICNGRRCPAIEYAVEQEDARIQSLSPAARRSLRMQILQQIKERNRVDVFRTDEYAHGLAIDWTVLSALPAAKLPPRL